MKGGEMLAELQKGTRFGGRAQGCSLRSAGMTTSLGWLRDPAAHGAICSVLEEDHPTGTAARAARAVERGR